MTNTVSDPYDDLDEQDLDIETAEAGNLLHKALALLIAITTLYAALTVSWSRLQAVSLFLLLILVYIFIRFPLVENVSREGLSRLESRVLYGFDGALILAAMVSVGYLFFAAEEIALRAGTATDTEIVLGFIAMMLVLEATRRSITLIVPLLALVFMLYPYVGQFIPGLFGHPGFSTQRVIVQMYLSTRGLFSFPLVVSHEYIYFFVLFGAFLEFSGGGRAFLDLAKVCVGKFVGGPAKLAVFSSGFMGMLSGSVIANTLTTGAFTIPTMRKTGYKRDFAAGVESAASTGGQLMPPVMGAVVFIMMELTGINYIYIIVHAAVPALLYFFAIYVAVHYQSVKSNLTGLPDRLIPERRSVFLRLYYFIPVFSLVWLLFEGYSVQAAIIYSTALLIGITFIPRNARLVDPRREGERLTDNPLVNSIEVTAKRTTPIVAAATTVGIIIGSVSLTGTGLKVSAALLAISGESILIALILVMFLCLIFGMATDTITVYILLAILVAPGLEAMGIPTFSAHMFIFYFGMMAMVTPPICLAAYAAATIAESDPIRSGFWAWKLALPAFLLPFLWVYEPAILLEGTTLEILRAIATALIGFTLLSIAVVRFMYIEISRPEQLILVAGTLLLLHPNMLTDVAGIVLGLVGLSRQFIHLFEIDVPELSSLKRRG